MAALLSVLATLKSEAATSGIKTKRDWLAPIVSSLLSKQLMRPGGITGLLNVLLGKSETGQKAKLLRVNKELMCG